MQPYLALLVMHNVAACPCPSEPKLYLPPHSSSGLSHVLSSKQGKGLSSEVVVLKTLATVTQRPKQTENKGFWVEKGGLHVTTKEAVELTHCRTEYRMDWTHLWLSFLRSKLEAGVKVKETLSHAGCYREYCVTS